MTESTLSSPEVWDDLIGKTFVLGMPNAKGEHIITLGGTRWHIANAQGVPAGERVKVMSQENKVLTISPA